MMVEYEVTAEDLAALDAFLGRRQPVSRSRVYWVGYAPAVLTLGVLAAMLLGGKARAASYVILVPPAFVYALFWTWFFWARLAPQLRPIADSKSGVGQHRLFLEAAGVRETRPQGEIFHHWGAVDGILEAPGHFFISVGPDGHYIIPKRAFTASDAASAFLASAKEQWRPSAISPAARRGS